MDKSIYLFENDHGYVTSDGRLIQKDNNRFKGRQLATCTEDTIDEIVGYYQKAFDDLKKYTETNLKLIQVLSDDEAEERKNILLREIEQANALGDFDELASLVTPAENLTPASDETSEAPSTDDNEQKAEPAEVTEAPEAEEKSEEKAEETAGTEEEKQPEAQEESVTLPELPENASDELKAYFELAKKAIEFTQQTDFQLVSHELSNIKLKWDETGSTKEGSGEESAIYNQLLTAMQNAEQAFYDRKAAYHEQQKEKRQKNLERREQLLDQLRALVKEEKWQAFGEVKSIQRKWDGIRSIPTDEGKKQQAELEKLLATFEEHKVEILVERRQKEEDNLTGKLTILDKMKALNAKVGPDTADWDATDKELEELSRQWRKVGRVPKEQSDNVWNQFRDQQDAYFASKFEHNEAYRKELLKNVEKRKRIINEAKELQDEEDLALASRKINQLHRRWKKIGMVPKEENDKLWDEFKEASDKFNEIKSENIDVIKEQEQENLELKEALIKKAEEIRDAQDWQKGNKQMQALMEDWKKVGPPPRRKASKLWKKFKSVMDEYYDARRQYFKEIKGEQKENYAKKKEIIEKIKALAENDDAQDAIKQVKELQQAFNDIGFVPIKQKDKIYKAYKEACDVIYQRARAESGNLPGTRHMEFAEGVSTEEKKDARLKQAEILKLKKERDQLNEEILRNSDMKTFIKPNKGGIKLIEELDGKIDAAKEKCEALEARMDELQQEIDKVQD